MAMGSNGLIYGIEASNGLSIVNLGTYKEMWILLLLQVPSPQAPLSLSDSTISLLSSKECGIHASKAMRRRPHGRARDEYACDCHEIHAAAEITPMKDLNVGHRRSGLEGCSSYHEA
jgi:hypothetical protein